MGKSGVAKTFMPVLRWSAVFVAFVLVAILVQRLGRAYSGEFSGADESAHFVTGLMIRDYVAAGFPTTPMKFAENYYLHYPKVAFGMWGPLLHVTEAAWTLILPPNRVSLLLLMAVISALTAFLLCRALVDEFGITLAATAGLLFFGGSTVERYTGMIMADGLVALMDFCAALAFGRYLNTRRWKYAIWFGVFTNLSILTKGNGVALLLLPVFAILFTRQWNILKEKPFWAAVALIAFIGGPWQIYSGLALIGISSRVPGGVLLPGYTLMVITLFGIAILPVIAAGVYDQLIAPARGRPRDGIWISAAALICSVWAFHSIVPITGVDRRYLIAIMPPLLMFLIAGIRAVARWTAFLPIGPHLRLWITATIVVLIFLMTNYSVPQKRHFGFDEVAEYLEGSEYKDGVFLVSSQAQDGEGMLISEIAMREKRPSHIILRATKMLSQSDWMGRRYSLLYNTPQEVMNFLKATPVEVVVIQDQEGETEYPDHKLLQQTIKSYPEEWAHIGTFPQRGVGEPGSKIDVYRLKSAVGRTASKIRINLPFTLKHSVEN
jgi:Dolichyl-phosphate-mannose-protein mannosyltransferase